MIIPGMPATLRRPRRRVLHGWDRRAEPGAAREDARAKRGGRDARQLADLARQVRLVGEAAARGDLRQRRPVRVRDERDGALEAQDARVALGGEADVLGEAP